VATSAAAATLRFPGNRVDEPLTAEAALRFVADPAQRGTTFTAGMFPGELTEAARLALARKLVREGFLELAR
jgi:hypothetical protein